MQRIRIAVAAALIAGMVGLPQASAFAASNQDHVRRAERRDDRREEKRDRREERRDRREDRRDRRDDRRDWRRYDARHFEPGQRSYDASRYYYRDDRRYKVVRLGRNDRIYRGSDSRYYCHRDDGTTGLIIGAVGGGVLGNIIAPGGSETLGTLIGAGAGALIGRAIDRGDVQCR